MRDTCPCKKKKCPRHGDCKACREHHANSGRKRSVNCERHITVRPFKRGDENGMSEVIAHTLLVSNKNDYFPEYLNAAAAEHSPSFFTEREKDTHFYVVCDRKKIIGCGGITGYWGSMTESYLLSVFVLPDYQGRGLGRKIIEALEADEFFQRAWRTEVGSSLTATGFYQKMGYVFKNGVTVPDEAGVVRLEKRSRT